jgi:hypothetical protein
MSESTKIVAVVQVPGQKVQVSWTEGEYVPYEGTGNIAEAKRSLEAHGVPCTPMGYHETMLYFYAEMAAPDPEPKTYCDLKVGRKRFKGIESSEAKKVSTWAHAHGIKVAGKKSRTTSGLTAERIILMAQGFDVVPGPEFVGPVMTDLDRSNRDTKAHLDTQVTNDKLTAQMQREQFLASHGPPKVAPEVKKVNHVIMVEGKRVPWSARWSYRFEEMSVSGFRDHEHMNQIVCPRSIPIYGPGYNPAGHDYLEAFDGMRVVTFPLFKAIVEDGNGNRDLVPMNLDDRQLSLYRDAWQDLLASDKVVGLVASEHSVRVVVDEKKRGWLWWLNARGLEFPAGDKGMKRAKPHLSGHGLVATFSSAELSMKTFGDKGDEKVYDGPCVVSTRLVAKCLRKLGVKGDKARRFMKAKKLVLRVDVPGGGMVKALAYVVPHSLMPADVDLYTHEVNVKKEVKNGDGWAVMLDVKRSHRKPKTNTMCSDNFSGSLFKEPVMKFLFDSWMQTTLMDLRDSVPLEAKEDLDESHEETWEEHLNSIYLMRRRAALALTHTGLTPRHSKTTLEQVLAAKCRNVLSDYGDRISLPIPCARYLPVISRSMAWLLNSKRNRMVEDMPSGKILYLPDYDVCVVSDHDWVKNMENHGGNDGDDDFFVLYRTDSITGEKKVVVYRMPNDKGEYAVYDPYVETDCPESEVSVNWARRKIRWPKADLASLPPQVSTLDREYAEAPKAPCPHASYTKEFAVSQVMRYLDDVSAGASMNVVMLMNHTGYTHDEPLLPMEKIIDTAVQGASSGDVLEIQARYQRVLERIAELKLPVDRTFGQRFRKCKDHKGKPLALNLVEGWVTRVRCLVRDWIGQENQGTGRWDHGQALAWVKENVVLECPPQVHGSRLCAKGKKAVGFLFDQVTRELAPNTYEEREGLSFQERKVLMAYYLQTCVDDWRMDPVEVVRYLAYLCHTSPTKAKEKKGEAPWSKARRHYETYRSDWFLTSGPDGHEHTVWDLYLEALATTRVKKVAEKTSEPVI